MFFKNMDLSRPLFRLFSSFSYSNYNFINTNCKKRRWCAWDSNPEPRRHRQNHGAMSAATRFNVNLWPLQPSSGLHDGCRSRWQGQHLLARHPEDRNESTGLRREETHRGREDAKIQTKLWSSCLRVTKDTFVTIIVTRYGENSSSFWRNFKNLWQI